MSGVEVYLDEERCVALPPNWLCQWRARHGNGYIAVIDFYNLFNGDALYEAFRFYCLTLVPPRVWPRVINGAVQHDRWSMEQYRNRSPHTAPPHCAARDTWFLLCHAEARTFDASGRIELPDFELLRKLTHEPFAQAWANPLTLVYKSPMISVWGHDPRSPDVSNETTAVDRRYRERD